MDAHEFANEATVVFGKLHAIREKAIVGHLIDIRDLAEDAIYNMTMMDKKLGNRLLEEPKDVMGAV